MSMGDLSRGGRGVCACTAIKPSISRLKMAAFIFLQLMGKGTTKYFCLVARTKIEQLIVGESLQVGKEKIIAIL